jgi:hypothetical protein
MDKETERLGKSAAEWLQSEVDGGELVRMLVDRSDLQDLLDYVKALEEPPVKVTTDVYLMGEWYKTILKVDLTRDQKELLKGLEERCGEWSTRLEVRDHNPDYPLPNWKGYTRK